MCQSLSKLPTLSIRVDLIATMSKSADCGNYIEINWLCYEILPFYILIWPGLYWVIRCNIWNSYPVIQITQHTYFMKQGRGIPGWLLIFVQLWVLFSLIYVYFDSWMTCYHVAINFPPNVNMTAAYYNVGHIFTVWPSFPLVIITLYSPS